MRGDMTESGILLVLRVEVSEYLDRYKLFRKINVLAKCHTHCTQYHVVLLVPDLPLLCTILGIDGNQVVQVLPLQAFEAAHGPIPSDLLTIMPIRSDTLPGRFHDVSLHELGYNVLWSLAILELLEDTRRQDERGYSR